MPDETRLTLDPRISLIVLTMLACGCTDEPRAPTTSSEADTGTRTAEFRVSLPDLGACLDAEVQGIDPGQTSDAIHLTITRKTNLSECGCVFPDQGWLPAEFIDADGALVYGVDVDVPTEPDRPSVQTFDLFHSKFQPFSEPYRIEIRCETTMPPG